MKSILHATASAAVLSLALAGAVYAQQGAEKAPGSSQGPRAAQQHEGHGVQGQGRGHGMGGHRMGRGMMGQCGGEDHAAMHQGMGMGGHGQHEQGGSWGGNRPKQQ